MLDNVSNDSAYSSYQRRCLETLRTALERTPMYESWRAYDPGDGFPVDRRYAALPALTKAGIRACFPYGLVPRGLDLDAAIARQEASFVKTSGTSDESLTSIWNQQWWDESERASWTLNSAAAGTATGSHREAILASALSVGPRSDGPPLARDERMLGRFLFLNEYGSTAQWPPGHELRILAELAEYQPPVLEANPSLLARLARFAVRAGIAAFQPALITLTYELPSRLQLRAIKEVFGAPVASSYGSTEAGYVFMECEQGRLHQNADFCRVDLIPFGGAWRDGGRTGRLLVSTFGNRWFPLVRFEIGDVARMAAGPCPCGRNLGLTLASIEGRLISLCQAADGQPVTLGELDEALSTIDGLEEYRLDQEMPDQVLLRAVSEGRAREAVLGDAREVLEELFGGGMEITVEPADRLLPEPSGKFLLSRRWFPLDPELLNAGGRDVHGR